MMVSIRDEENSHLKKKITLLETFLQNSIQNTQTDTSQVLEELKQINETMLVKAQKTSESLLAESNFIDYNRFNLYFKLIFWKSLNLLKELLLNLPVDLHQPANKDFVLLFKIIPQVEVY